MVTPIKKLRSRKATENAARDTLERQMQMIRAIPRYPSRITAGQLAASLSPRVHVRTVQRDLKRFMGQCGYTWENEGKTEFWYYPKDFRGVDIPGMSAPVAIAMLLARENMLRLMPPSVVDALDPYFRRAEDILSEASTSPLKTWKKRICVISRGPPLASPQIAESVAAIVYECVLEGAQVKLRYRARAADAAAEQLLHPLGLVLREGVMYLVAMAWDYPDARHYALHRIVHAERMGEPARRAPGFDLGQYVERTFSYPRAPRKVRLVMYMDKGAATHIEERPLSPDQKMSGEGEVARISATVDDTEELRWWLLGFGSLVEVLQPVALRRELSDTARRMTERYAG